MLGVHLQEIETVTVSARRGQNREVVHLIRESMHGCAQRCEGQRVVVSIMTEVVSVEHEVMVVARVQHMHRLLEIQVVLTSSNEKVIISL